MDRDRSENKYEMRISRLTVDKLGVKLYDKVSAAIAELVANSYDADATEVTVSAPMGKFLATRRGGLISSLNFEIRIEDDGVGMTPEQMQKFFLVVGADRRDNPDQGSESREFGRKVMGRKGVGKLAPFGICRTMEIISSGGEKTAGMENGSKKEGHLTSHIVIKYEKVASDTSKPYVPDVGEFDETLREQRGTTIILRDFNYRKVPEIDTLSRQLAQRFGIRHDKWKIVLEDNNPETDSKGTTRTVGEFGVDTLENTKIHFRPEAASQRRVVGPSEELISDLRPGFDHDDVFYKVSGWVAYARKPYRDELMAGVRIYCRGKIAAQTAIFNRRAGFQGEHNVRSYLVGELHADWLDEKEDLIRTDRRDIMWSDELCTAFEKWGQKIVAHIAKLSRDPMRKTTKELFFATGKVQERIGETFPSEDDAAIKQKALNLSEMFGKAVSRTEAEDEETVNSLVGLSIMIAPTVTFDEAMKKVAEKSQTALLTIISLLRTARIAELSSFGKIAEQRIEAIERLKKLKNDESTKERQLHGLIEEAPWLINPEWAPVTSNQTLETLRREFEKYHRKTTGKSMSLPDFADPAKRPDFVLLKHGNRVQIVEIKRPEHTLANDEMDRIIEYHDLMKEFLEDPANGFFQEHVNDFDITLVCDGVDLSGAQKAAYNGYKLQGKLKQFGWASFLSRVEQAHADFLKVAKTRLKQASRRKEDG